MPGQPGGSAVSDHEEIRALLQRYSRAADERDIDALASLFHPEAQIAGARGEQTLEEWLDTMRGQRTFPSSMHVLGDPLIAMDGDHRGATTDTYAIVYQLADPKSGGSDLTLGIRYLDELINQDGHWVIRRRSARTVWMR
jgi:SnoaL-like domain